MEFGFTRGSGDRTLFVLRTDKHLCVAQIYVDDIVFGATSKELEGRFVEAMTTTFEMSMIGELNYFLGLQVKQSSHEIGRASCRERVSFIV